MYPGTINWHQGLDIAVEGFSYIKDKMPDSEFHIYGEGPEKEALIKIINELDLKKRVFIRGFLSIERNAEVMA